MDTELRNRKRETVKKLSNGPDDPRIRSTSNRWFIKLILVAVIILFLVLLIVAPAVFRSSLAVRKSMLFMNWLNLPLFRNLSNPEAEYDLNCTRNFYIPAGDGIRLGAWHILPRSRIGECDLQNPDRLPASKAFDDGRQVILYLHGNGGARGGNHRKGLYKALAYSKLDYHVVAIDYRGYGDSSPTDPTAAGLVADAVRAYDWLLTQVKGRRDRITIWGHSLGTAIATYLVAGIDPLEQPSSVILEAPFNSVADAVRHHPFALLFSMHPLFEDCFVQPLAMHPETSFDTEAKIRQIHTHLLILHAEDDMIVPFSLGKKLFQTALNSRPASSPEAQFVTFDTSKKYGHKGIFKDDQLADIVSSFVDSSRKSS